MSFRPKPSRKLLAHGLVVPAGTPPGTVAKFSKALPSALDMVVMSAGVKPD